MPFQPLHTPPCVRHAPLPVHPPVGESRGIHGPRFQRLDAIPALHLALFGA